MIIEPPSAVIEDKEKEKHFGIVQGQFLSSALAAGSLQPRVLKVEYIVNPTLRQKFKETEELFAAKDKPTKKIYGFHGTKETNLTKIFEEGYKIGGKTTPGTHGDVYGKGVYFGTSPVLPDHYTKGRLLVHELLYHHEVTVIDLTKSMCRFSSNHHD